MKKILALTVGLMLCTVAPVQAGAIVNFGISNDNGSELIIIPSQQQYWEGTVGYQNSWVHPYYYPRHRYNRFYEPRVRGFSPRYRYNRFYEPRVRGFSPRYRYNRFYEPRVGESRPRHRDGRRYYPRRSFIQFGIGF